MVSIILFLVNLFRPKRIIQVRRVPPTKNLRAHLLGLALGLLFVTGNLCLSFTLAHLYQSFFVLVWFALVTYFGGVLIFLTPLFIFPPLSLLFSSLAGPAGVVFHGMLANGCHWYLLGYCFGAGLAIFYNDLLFLFLHTFEKKKIKIAFAYEARTRRSEGNEKIYINVIKSPKAHEEHAMNKLMEADGDIEDQKLYRYNLKAAPPYPYTIAFVANPKIRKGGGDATREDGYEPDPILSNLNLFLRTVDRALHSLETDPVIGRPEIWSRVRVVTVFNPVFASASGPLYGMVEEFQEELKENGRRIDNYVLDPMRQMFDSFKRMLDQSWGSRTPIFEADDVDVIFAVTASPTHTRSFAHSSDWIEHDDSNPLTNPRDRAGKCFTFTADPGVVSANGCTTTKFDIVYPKVTNETNAPPDDDPNFRAVHDYCPTRPGRVALSAIGSRHKTYIHEFAHAMASAFHGTITDEYVDCFVLSKVGSAAQCMQEKHFFVNRIDRRANATEPIHVPKIFAEYNCVQFHSDLAHPSAEEEWTGYFPDKIDKTTPCTMDRDITGYYRFDELLSSFIYDRMMAKVTRPAKCVHQIEPVPASQ